MKGNFFVTGSKVVRRQRRDSVGEELYVSIRRIKERIGKKLCLNLYCFLILKVAYVP